MELWFSVTESVKWSSLYTENFGKAESNFCPSNSTYLCYIDNLCQVYRDFIAILSLIAGLFLNALNAKQ